MKLQFGVMAVVLAACGGNLHDKTWDQNGDGLVQACEGLGQSDCEQDSGCEFQPYYCALVCEDTGDGGCLPCGGNGVCRAKPPPPPPSCSQIPVGACNYFSQCEVRTATQCSGSGGSGSGVGLDDSDSRGGSSTPPEEHAQQAGCGHPLPTPPTCTTLTFCADREVDCESRSDSTCGSDGKCALVAWACAAVCLDNGDGGCQPCVTPPNHCVPVQGPTPGPEPVTAVDGGSAPSSP